MGGIQVGFDKEKDPQNSGPFVPKEGLEPS
jgi:hypothetical protein